MRTVDSENAMPSHGMAAGAPGHSIAVGRTARTVQPLRRSGMAPALCDITNTGLTSDKATMGPLKATSASSACHAKRHRARAASARPRSRGATAAPMESCRPGHPAEAQRSAAGSARTPPATPVLEPIGTQDERDRDDPQSVAEYAPDIYNNLMREETTCLPAPDYMESQADINARMRAILVDGLMEMHRVHKLKTETLFLAVSLIDRFLAKRQITRKRLQLVGITAMLIAAKFEEIHPPAVGVFVHMAGNAYTTDDILNMEVTMLAVLQFVVCYPTVAHFFERYARAMCCSEAHHHLMQYVLELALLDMKMLRYTPSHLAAAAALLSNMLLNQQPHWPAIMARHTQQTESMFKGCAWEMCSLLMQAEGNPLQAAYRKFSQPEFSFVAKRTS